MSDSAPLPKHIAFIMDGNGRWAQARGLKRLEGHRQGVLAVRRTIAWLLARGIAFGTFYAFSSENWRRPVEEVDGLMGLFRHFFDKEIAELHAQGVRVIFLGDRTPKGGVPEDILALMARAEEMTRNNNRLQVGICLNYGSRQELVQAVKAVASQVAEGELDAENVNEDSISTHLYSKDFPDPDVCIRTSGEQRLSNFLLWQLSYAELVFEPTPWPAIDENVLDKLMAEFTTRNRRFGGLNNAAAC